MIKARLLSSLQTGNITITDAAWNKISNILKKTGGISFVFSAKGGGCNGFNYDFRSIDVNEYQQIINNSGKIKPTILAKNTSQIIIDPLSEFLLFDTKIDYYEDIYENKFLFKRNKYNISSCGCGTSFNIK